MGVQVMARAGISSLEVGVEVPVVEVVGRQLWCVSDVGGAGIDHDTVVRVVVGLPDAHHRKMVLVHAVDGSRLVASDVHRSARVKPRGPEFTIPLVQGHLIVFECKG